ncbi:unnamed protein product [Darwinula stevensoni]|uniref:mRNA-decapping enzyme C-terminal domain-containing protein n=1 Tax=Darwinula stevensoni TaxID=69355 RepID=A0A7R9AE80_9CRUS|nr:unnamed protein product [Darwinula stevensoni]CAG0902072.1 unnamed protein product [Darwinula stevensoni]
MNLTSVKRVDPYTSELIDTASHVALYVFVNNQWEKTDIEGALFIYERDGAPFHNFVIINRLNTTNKIEPVTKDLECQTQSPFLLYKNSQGQIYGIWFWEVSECERIGRLLAQILQNLNKNSMDGKKQFVVGGGGGEKQPTGRLVRPQPVHVGMGKASPGSGTTLTVEDFFAKASGATVPHIPKPAISPAASHTPNVKVPIRSPGGGEVLQRVLSNPAHCVEHIERLQRNEPPAAAGLEKDLRDSLHLEPPPAKAKNEVVSLQELFDTVPKDTLTPPPPTPLSAAKEEDLMEFGTCTSPVVRSSEVTTPTQRSSNVVLMSPMMFTSSKDSKDIPQPPSGNGNASSVQSSSGEWNGWGDSDVTPLTKNQLLQALEYLLKNDVDFVAKLHEAYVKSLNARTLQKL